MRASSRRTTAWSTTSCKRSFPSPSPPTAGERQILEPTKKMKRSFLIALALLALALPSFADDYPTRPVKIVVENRPGAGSTIGTDAVAKSPADGYTLAMVSTTHVISPHLYKKMPYDALAD